MRNKYIFYLLFLLFPFIVLSNSDQEFPVLFKGRFRPAEAYARLWLYDIHHAQRLKTDSALDFMLKLDTLGHQEWDQTPLFWIGSKDIKKLAGLNLKRTHFTYDELYAAFYTNPETSSRLFAYLLEYEFIKAYASSNLTSKFELKNIAPGIELNYQAAQITIISKPKDSQWQALKKGQVFNIDPQSTPHPVKDYKKNADHIFTLIANLQTFASLNGTESSLEKKFQAYFLQLKNQNLSPKEIKQALESYLPTYTRLNQASSLLLALPGIHDGSWFPLKALNLNVYSMQHNRMVPINNFTLYSHEEFENIRQNYHEWTKSVLNNHVIEQQIALNKLSRSLLQAYQNLAGQISTEANGKVLYYPTLNQLKAESIYYQYPWIKLLIIFYTSSIILLYFAYRLNSSFIRRSSITLLIFSFIFHTALLIGRSYLLNRPPVSNMFETVFYVPWVTLGGALLISYFRKSLFPLLAATIAAVILLTLIEFTELNQSLDNVQAVLDSQFWLFTHVLLVVGSYGLFILGAILAHFYLIFYLIYRRETHTMRLLSESILQSIYLGLVMLIPGTLLGGVWAAESWGRFWDWDPKEAWAFISICVYLIGIHAYRYHKIHSFGLAIGAILGLLAISFTWYGVNFILGTGLHSYGFGSGGENFYYAFVIIEIIFTATLLVLHHKKIKQKI